MKKHLTPSLVAALALSLGLSGCIITIDDSGASWHGLHSIHSSGHGPRHRGSGETGADERVLEAFHSVELEGSLDVQVTVIPDAGQQVAVIGDDNLLAFVRTEVQDGVLHVDLDSGSYEMKQPLRVVATLPDLRRVELEGSGDILAEGIDNDAFRVSLEGSGDIQIKGRTGTLEAGLYGSGDVDLGSLHAGTAEVSLEGSGDVRVHADDSLHIRLEGSGDIGYAGSPQVKVHISGSGDVYKFD